MKRRSFATRVVEAGYRLDGTEADWFQRVLAGLAPELEHGFGAMAIIYHMEGGRLVLDRLVGSGCPAPLVAFTRTAYEGVPPAVAREIQSPDAEFYSYSEFARRLPRRERSAYHAALEQAGIGDALVATHPDGAGGWIAFSGLTERPFRTVPRQRAAWRRICAHLATAWRLRRRLRSTRAVIDQVLASGDPAAATDVWKGVLSGRWSIIDRAGAPGDRLLVAHRNDPGNPDPRRLSPRERVIVDLALTGASSKRIAYALGLSPPTIASHLARALRKLNLDDRIELMRLGGLAGETAPRLTIGHDELAVLRLGATREPAPLPLTPAERAVARLVAEGLSNAAIAWRRGRATRTVANQVASIFEKLGVGSRAELVLALSRSAPR